MFGSDRGKSCKGSGQKPFEESRSALQRDIVSLMEKQALVLNEISWADIGLTSDHKSLPNDWEGMRGLEFEAKYLGYDIARQTKRLVAWTPLEPV